MTVDEKILNGIERAKKEGIKGWDTKGEAIGFFGFSRDSLTNERIARIESEGLSMGARKVMRSKESIDRKILDGIERAKKEGIKGWDTKSEAGRFFGFAKDSLTNERIVRIESEGLSVGVGASFTEKKEAIDQKIPDGIERAKKEGIKGWNTRIEAARFFGIAQHTLTDERITHIESEGLSVAFGVSYIERREVADRKILDGIERAKKEGVEGWSTKSEAARFFGVNNNTLTKKRIALIESEGLSVGSGGAMGRKKATDRKILHGIERAKKEGIKGWNTRIEAARFFGIVQHTLTDERISLIESKGLSLTLGKSHVERKKAIDQKILDGIERAKKEGIKGWDIGDGAARFFGVSKGALTKKRIALIESEGLYVAFEDSNIERKKAIDQKILDGIERAQKEGIKGWDTLLEAASFFDVSKIALTKRRIILIESKGLSVAVGGSIKSRETIDQKILDGIERAKKEGIKGWSTRSEAARFLKVSVETLNEKRIARMRSEGFTIKAKIETTPNMLFAIRSSEELGIRIDSAQALTELSLDFFGREIRISDEAIGTLAASTKVVENFNDEEAKGYIGAVAWELIENEIEDFSILELKLGLFREQVYFSEHRIESCLNELDMNTDELHLHTMKKRFRLAMKAVEYGLVEVNYTDNLPSINNCENRNIFIHNSIRSRSSFMKLWKEYAEIMMRENLGGSISRSSLPESLTIEEEIKKNSSRAKAYLLGKDSIGHLEKLGYEGIAALFLYGTRKAKNSLPRSLHSLAARLTGFFLFLSQKGLAVGHSRFLTFTGGKVVSDVARYFTLGHAVTKALPGFISSAGSKTIERFPLLAHKLAISVRHDADLKNLSSEEINTYVDGIKGEDVSGTLKLDSFCIRFLQDSGNINALERRSYLDVKAHWTKELLNSSVSTDVLNWYKTLIEQLVELIEGRYNDEAISETHTIAHIKAIVFLFEFLSTFDHKLSRKEMIDVLNPKIKSNKKEHIIAWSENTNRGSSYSKHLPKYATLFANISDATYLGLFPVSWIKMKDGSPERSYIRDGLELPVLTTFQDAVLSEPFPDERYPFLRSTPKGELIDMSSWWGYDFSPVPVICAWLVSKLPRRGKHIRFLDVNKFLVFNPDGTLKGISFNTDKNVNADAKKDLYIPKSLLIHAFTEDELQLLINYTKYISQAYSFIEPVKYTSKKYPPIIPLFPHHNRHDVLSDIVLKGYMTKVMIKTQIIVRHNAKNGVYDPYYSPSALELKKKYLSTIDLVTSKGKYSVPESIEELKSLTVNQCRDRYRLEQGVHNFRHAISTALAHLGLSIFRVRVFTGHSNIDTLGNVYMHGEEEVISLLRATTSTFFDDIRSPAEAGNQFISKICMPLVKSKDPSAILKALKDHGFMSLPRKIQKGPEGVKINTTEGGIVSDGVEIASLFNPVSWVSKSFGICAVGEGCPDESRGICSLCPFLIFNASFVKGIILELNDALNEFAILNAKNVESIRSNSADEVHKQVAQKMSEVMGWNHMFSRVEAQLLGEDADLVSSGGTSITGLKIASKNLFGVRTVSIDESDMEILYGAMELDLNDVKFDKKAKGVAWRIAMRCAKNKDFATLEQLEKDGLHKFISEFGKMNFKDKKTFVLEMMGGAESAPRSPLVQQENASLLPEIIE